MSADMRQNPAVKADGEMRVLTINGRDEAWTHRAMAELFAGATRLNLSPVLWQVGYFVLRDLVKARDPLMRQKNRFNRPDTVWGCGISVIMLADYIALVAVDPSTRAQTVLVASEDL